MALSTTTKAPTGWAANAAHQNFLRAQGIADQPYTPYAGNLLAGWNPGQQMGYNAALNSGGIGLGAMQQAQNFATQAGQYQPPMVGLPTAATPQGQAAATGWASAGNATAIPVQNTEAANAGNAQGFGVTNTGFASAGPAQQMAAAQMGRGDVRDVQAQNFTQANLGQYMNPYISNVVDTTLGQLGRQNDILQTRANAQAAKAGAFGGGRQAVMNAENNRAFMDTAASATSNLYNQGFNTAQQAIAKDQDRALTAAQNNQQADWNVGSANLKNRQEAGYQNMLAGNEMARYNATNQQSGIEATAAAHNTAAQKYAEQQNLMAQYNATNQQTAYNNTAAAHNTIAQQYASNADAMARYNTGNQQRGLEATAAQANDMTQANMQAATTVGNANADLALRGQLGNQQASQYAVNSRIQAANALNGMGMDEQTRALNAARAQYEMGQARTAYDQTGLDNAYNQWAAAQNYPMRQLDILQQGLNGYSSGETTTAPGQSSNRAANVLAGALGGGQLGYDLSGGMKGWGALGAGAGALLGMFG